MSDPNTEQITVWRNLLDAFSQLSAAWEAAEEAQRTAGGGRGPGALRMPESLISSFVRAGEESADALTGVATVLSYQPGLDTDNTPQRFTDIAEAQRLARDQWREAHTIFEQDQQS